jgi:hypothetical protein
MTDDETLQVCLYRLAALIELAEQIPQAERARVERTIDIMSRAVHEIDNARQAKVAAKRRVDEVRQIVRIDAGVSDAFGSSTLKASRPVHSSKLHHLFSRLSLAAPTGRTEGDHMRKDPLGAK